MVDLWLRETRSSLVRMTCQSIQGDGTSYQQLSLRMVLFQHLKNVRRKKKGSRALLSWEGSSEIYSQGLRCKPLIFLELEYLFEGCCQNLKMRSDKGGGLEYQINIFILHLATWVEGLVMI